MINDVIYSLLILGSYRWKKGGSRWIGCMRQCKKCPSWLWPMCGIRWFCPAYAGGWLHSEGSFCGMILSSVWLGGWWYCGKPLLIAVREGRLSSESLLSKFNFQRLYNSKFVAVNEAKRVWRCCNWVRWLSAGFSNEQIINLPLMIHDRARVLLESKYNYMI